MARLKDVQVRNLKAGGKVSEPVGSRGDGTLLLKCRASGAVEAYYRYREVSTETLIKIGQYRVTRDGHGYSLAECRDKAQELATTRRECGSDLKEHLDTQSRKAEQARQEARRKQEIEAARGTFADLIAAYVEDQKRQERTTAHQSEQALKRNVIKAYPNLAAKKARDITPQDITDILATIHNRGSEVESVRVRAVLSGCFSFGLKSDYDPTRVGDKRFFLQHNPVASTKKNTNATRVGQRVLSHPEIRQLWEGVTDVHRVGFVLGLFVRFMLATAGQRPTQLASAKWEDYDFQRNCVTLVDRKGRVGTVKVHVVPLSRRALDILEEVRKVSADYPWPFCTGVKSRRADSKGELVPIGVGSLKNAFKRYNLQLVEEAESSGIDAPEWFTARDIRRTVKNLLIDAGVNREQRNLLQSHGQSGVDIKHYDRHEHLQEKRESMRRYDALLNRVLSGEDVKLVDLGKYRESIV